MSNPIRVGPVEDSCTCEVFGDDHMCPIHGDGGSGVTPPAPPGLDFEAARLSCPRVGEWGHVPRDLQLALNVQHLAALQQARRDFAAECRTRLVAIDPVGLTTGPLFDWLTKEMGV